MMDCTCCERRLLPLSMFLSVLCLVGLASFKFSESYSSSSRGHSRHHPRHSFSMATGRRGQSLPAPAAAQEMAKEVTVLDDASNDAKAAISKAEKPASPKKPKSALLRGFARRRHRFHNSGRSTKTTA
mmetsp:Transcript_48333/g.87168  ORF Transcript_48333/g.87168 Transcript_48333/m.87168 type:complete len:128 (+) Transcript_48333:59-442(+)